MPNIDKMKEKFVEKTNEKFPRIDIGRTVNIAVRALYDVIEDGKYNIVGDMDTPVGEITISPRSGILWTWMNEQIIVKEIKAKLKADGFITVHGIYTNVSRHEIATIIIEFEVN